MLIYSGMSVENYDSTLISWQVRSHLNNVYLGVDSLRYCASDSARNLLIANGWVFSGDTLNCLGVGIDEEVQQEHASFKIYPNQTVVKFLLKQWQAIYNSKNYSFTTCKGNWCIAPWYKIKNNK